MNRNLNVHTPQQVLSLAESLEAFSKLIGESSATGILYSARNCQLSRFTAGELKGTDDKTLDIEQVFEVRVFDQTAELRWLNDPSGHKQHRSVILTEKDLGQSLSGWNLSQQSIIQTLPQTYLLWGEGTGKSIGDHWSQLATSRIGGLSVPLANVAKNHRVLLHSIEYIAQADHHGNAVVVDERLIKFESPEVVNG